MDDLTKKVKEMYTQFPFPSEEYDFLFGPLILKYFYNIRGKKKFSYLEGASILDAGCGTGGATIALARQFPDSKVTGIDISPQSLEIAKEKSRDISNIEFHSANLLDFDLGEKFDVVLSMGVLHHLANPVIGLKNLKKHLLPGGRIILWLYGTYGRYRLNLNQRMLSILFKSVESLQEKIKLTKDLLSKGHQDSLSCYFNVPNQRIEHKWELSRDWILTKDEWIVDQFLHYNETTLNIEDIFKLCDETELILDKWLGIRKDILHLIPDDRINKLFDSLSDREKLIVIDLFLKPTHYTVVLK